ncbi:hypothetical protein [Pyxidicoccus trucidator]|uniref:hypothetical protein n=1 Tax=Pyxidicoccus trucidator TaxID=2709662 RepID=UPI0013DB22CC|nr:hypothetical protein [Pyxidicoccus trucidator]
MRTWHLPRSTPLAGAALLPTLVAALLPKCPVCIAVYLSAFGLGASIAQDAAPWVLRAANGLAAAVLGLVLFRLGMRARRSRRYGPLAVWTLLSTGALLVLATRG